MDEFLWGASPLRGLSEATASWRQLHVTIQFDPSSVIVFAVRPCGMEARGQAWNRTPVNPRSGRRGFGQVCLATRRPMSDRGSGGRGGGVHAKRLILTPGDLHCSTFPGRGCGNGCEGNDASVTAVEKSDHPIVALKPGNAGGAKGVTS